MARRPRPTIARKPATSREPKETAAPPERSAPTPLWTRPRLIIAVAALLGLHTTLAMSSLVRENPTVDEVAHMPAGVSYWQTGSFKLYHHNPPLVKLVAALPVVMAGPATAELYKRPSWTSKFPDHSTFAYEFALLNADRYFELFTAARLLMPLFSVLGGLVVFLWAKQLYGPWGGLLSLSLWVLCPNVLAHTRLVTTDIGATALGVAATYLFWRYLEAPSWRRVIWAGVVLGLAELAKFSMLLLYGLWPLLWLIHELGKHPRAGWPRRWRKAVGQGAAIVAISVLVINIGYGFERTGLPVGSPELEFGCKTLTRPISPGRIRPISPNPLFNGAWKERENRFRKTWRAAIPAPLPKEYLLGFDEQKLESEGVPRRWVDPTTEDNEIVGYPVYLDGQLRQTGWRSYYFWAAVYKVPEGTWILLLLATAVLFFCPHARAAWPDELILLLVPLIIVVSMSVLTDINLGLRYVLPIFPYLFIATGKLAPWVATQSSPSARKACGAVVASSLALTAAATLTIHPHFLAYFNWASGGPAHGSDHLIDSNLDWGQDLVNLREWAEKNAPGERIGLAYFGQINPSLFKVRKEPFDWFLAPGRPGSLTPRVSSQRMVGPERALHPGVYAVSVTLLRGLPWRLYDPELTAPPQAWSAARNAYSDFLQFTPIARIGESIYVYRLSEADVTRLNELWRVQPAPATAN